MGITEAGRKKLVEVKVVDYGQRFVRRGQKAQESVGEIMADANRNVELEALKSARRDLRQLDRARARKLRQIADLTSKLGLTKSERRNGV